VDELVDPSFVDHDPYNPGGGRDGVRQFFSMFYTAFPDIAYDMHEVLAEGDKAMMYGTMHGTQQGEFMGVPATGKAVAVSAVDIVRFADGKMVEHWGLVDQLALLQQLGVVPPSQA
jgi:steroid delta-isomerase-like uncharacterized protein